MKLYIEFKNIFWSAFIATFTTGKFKVAQNPLQVFFLNFAESLRWLKPVSTLTRDLVIRRIDTTTLYHVIIAEEDAVIFVT